MQVPEGKLPPGRVRAGVLGPPTGSMHRTTTGPWRLSSKRNGGGGWHSSLRTRKRVPGGSRCGGRSPSLCAWPAAVLAQSGGACGTDPGRQGGGSGRGCARKQGPGPAVPVRGPQPQGLGPLWERSRWLSPRPMAAATPAGKLSAARGGETSGPPWRTSGAPGLRVNALPSPPNKPRPASWLETTRFTCVTANELEREGRTRHAQQTAVRRPGCLG